MFTEAVHNACTDIIPVPSPTKAITGWSGNASFIPNAPPIPHPNDPPRPPKIELGLSKSIKLNIELPDVTASFTIIAFSGKTSETS